MVHAPTGGSQMKIFVVSHPDVIRNRRCIVIGVGGISLAQQ
jgi:hypothetical protein